MASYKTTGIVLARFNLGEADRIISFLTPDHGKLRAVARGVRRIKSRMAGHLELFSQVELMLATGRNLDVITSARLIQYGQHLSDDYDRLQYGYLVAEVLALVVPEREPHATVYEVATETLMALNEAAGDGLLELYFKLKVLDGLGYHPQLTACVVCGRNVAGKYFFSPSLGGIVDESCRTGEAEPITERQIKLWRLVMQNRLAALRRIDGVAEIAASSLGIVDRFYRYHFGRGFRTREVLQP